MDAETERMGADADRAGVAPLDQKPKAQNTQRGLRIHSENERPPRLKDAVCLPQDGEGIANVVEHVVTEGNCETF
jgi:hypothetical protein